VGMDFGCKQLNVINLKFLAVLAPVDDCGKFLDRMEGTFIMATSLMINLLVLGGWLLEFMAVQYFIG
jgi:hypothetical protein